MQSLFLFFEISFFLLQNFSGTAARNAEKNSFGSIFTRKEPKNAAKAEKFCL